MNNPGRLVGYYFNPTDEVLLEYLFRLNKGIHINHVNHDTVARVNLFERHPAVVIRNHNIRPCKRDTRNTYAFYCKVPDHTNYNEFGYHQIQDGVKGVWEATGYSSLMSRSVVGEVQRFRYKPVDRATSSWRMVLYGIPDSQEKMVICKVFEMEDSETAKAVRSHIEADKDLEECHNIMASQANKVELLRAALGEEDKKYRAFKYEIWQKSRLVAKKMREWDDVERREADAIEPDANEPPSWGPKRKRTGGQKGRRMDVPKEKQGRKRSRSRSKNKKGSTRSKR